MYWYIYLLLMKILSTAYIFPLHERKYVESAEGCYIIQFVSNLWSWRTIMFIYLLKFSKKLRAQDALYTINGLTDYGHFLLTVETENRSKWGEKRLRSIL
jgi:hypothetical protein